jgi:hypothetical protein
MDMPELSFKNLIMAGVVLMVSSVISGYFFSIGSDLWEITKTQNAPFPAVQPFWYVSVPLGIIGIVLLVLAIMKRKEPESQSTLILGVRLDPRLEHVQLHVFWRLRRVLTHQPEWIKRQDEFPRNKYIVNYKTKKAYSVGAYAWSLLVPYRQVEMHSETKWFPFYQRFWCWKRGFTVIPHAATEADLLEGTESIPLAIPLVMKTSDRGYAPNRAARLDPKLAGVHALFFWPKKVSWQRGERNPYLNMPYSKVVIKGMDAFWWGTYAEELFREGKIDHNNAEGDFEREEEMEFWLRKNGFNLHKQPVSQVDLLGNVD